MGASASGGELSPLAVAAVAEITQFDADRLRTLKLLFLDIVRPSSDDDDDDDATDDAPRRALSEYRVPYARHREPNLSRAQFLEALESADFFSSDVAIFDRMFTLLDRSGDELIFAHEFLIGVCALLRGDLAAKLQVAFELLHETSQPISKDDLAFVLHTMNQTATYFGDPAVVRKTVDSAADDVFAFKNAGDAPPQDDATEQQDAVAAKPDELLLTGADVAARVMDHALVDQYLRGQVGTSTSALLRTV